MLKRKGPNIVWTTDGQRNGMFTMISMFTDLFFLFLGLC